MNQYVVQRYIAPIIVSTLCAFFGSMAYSAADNADMVKASYLQLDAVVSLSPITQSGYASSNIILFAFADLTSSSAKPGYLAAMQTAINHQRPGR